jgi:hypothetical protein
MSVTEPERHELFNRIEEVLGAPSATTLMNLLPPLGWADVATKRDISRLDDRFDGVDERIAGIGGRLDRLEAKVDSNARSYVTWLFASQAAVIAVVVGAAALIIGLR